MKIIVANWKMNYGFDDVDDWLEGFYKTYSENSKNPNAPEAVVCPPNILLDYIDSELIEDGFHFLEFVASKQGRGPEDFTPEEITKYVYEARPIQLGAQDCGIEESGQFTGDVSAKLLKEVNCNYVILGHSERRINYCETNEMVSKKAIQAYKNSITPIICVGESKELRDQNRHFDFVKEQLEQSIPLIEAPKLVIAYEPIWSIGTGNTALPAQIEEMINFIHQFSSQKLAKIVKNFYVIYGGSVNSSNSSEILNIKGVDGLLVGKASLNIEEFSKILLSQNQPNVESKK
ncbi:MAG: triose-phosphate isomerase [Proteobacteria bacterium]|nr:triose-phosphate isomerase [Pseudomonadota bacterium]NCA27884.1 triose-phosphate isomerase [Pseudomonadota bacterium]